MNMPTPVPAAVDASDLPITAADPRAALGYDAYAAEFLSYGRELRVLFEVADAAPDAPLLNAHAAALHLAFEGVEGWLAARPYLARARAGARYANERERLFIAAVERWAARDFAGALGALDALSVRWPADLCAIKWAQYHAFNLGDARALLRLGERARIVHEGRPYVHGMLAFALEQNHRLREAEAEGRRAVEIALDDAWAHHAVAHVMDAEGRAEDGVRWMDRCAHVWDRKGVFIREHNWWHAALFRLVLGRADEALAIFDRRLWGEWPAFPQEQIGAISMLWRLEMRGVDPGERWAPVIDEVRARASDHILPFHDLHYAYALARAGAEGESAAFLKGVAKRAEDDPVWRDIALPAAEGVVAFAHGDRETAASRLAPVMGALHRIGGSHAQRQIFKDALAACSGEDLRREL